MTAAKDIDIRAIGAWVLIFAGSIAILLYFKNFLRPLVLAVVLWFLMWEIRKHIGRIRVFGRAFPKIVVQILSFVVVSTLLYFIVDIIIVNIEKLVLNFDRYSANIDASLLDIESMFN